MTTSVYPTSNNLISHHHSSTGQFPKTTYIVTFVYPDCIRTFDGKDWRVYPRKKVDLSTDGIHGILTQ